MSVLQRDYWPTADWRAASPESQELDPAGLTEADKIVQVKLRGVNAFLVVRHGYLVWEKYSHGFGPEAAHAVMSVTKSFISALIGIALDQGYLVSVEQKVLDFFPDLAAGETAGWLGEITLRHLLTMTAGFQWRAGARGYEPLMGRLWHSRNWVEFIVNLPGKANQIGQFQYNSAVSHLLSAILTRATGGNAQTYANAHLFGPIGASLVPAVSFDQVPRLDRDQPHTPQWGQDPQGNTFGGWGLVVRPRDMARFGYLYLNEGQWDDRQIISRQWVSASTRAHTPGYGYQWWVRTVAGTPVYAAVGRGGHHIFCVPAQDLVVVIASQQGSRWNDRWVLVEKYLLPACR